MIRNHLEEFSNLEYFLLSSLSFSMLTIDCRFHPILLSCWTIFRPLPCFFFFQLPLESRESLEPMFFDDDDFFAGAGAGMHQRARDGVFVGHLEAVYGQDKTRRA